MSWREYARDGKGVCFLIGVAMGMRYGSEAGMGMGWEGGLLLNRCCHGNAVWFGGRDGDKYMNDACFCNDLG